MKFIHVSLTVKSEKAEFYEHTFGALRRLVLANEPGCRVFELCRDPETPDAYHVFEAYDGDEAIRAHGAAPYYEPHARLFLECVKGDHMAEIERRGLTGRAMFEVVQNIKFERYESLCG